MSKSQKTIKIPKGWIEIRPGEFAHPQSELIQKTRKKFEPIRDSVINDERIKNTSGGRLSDSEPERDEASALGETIQGEEKGEDRIIVRFGLCRCKLLDTDNLYASVKDLLDGIKDAGLIPDDKEEDINLQVNQTKVSRRKDEKTVIEIEYP